MLIHINSLMEKTFFHLVVLVFLLKPFMACSARTITNLTTDQCALLAFKSHITNDPSNILAKNWSTTTSICYWIGVSCDFSHQRVIALSLSGLGLRGTIAPHLGNLTFLASLDVSSNRFQGFIPEQLTHLRRLRKFDLQHNNFTGEVPSWFVALPKLQHLLLGNNDFAGTIPISVCNISKLETLNLRFNFLRGRIPEAIGSLSQLKSLNLSDNQLTGSIPSVIFNMSSLKEIDLSSNNLSDSLPLDICNHLPKLQLLYLSSNQLHGQIPQNIYKCKELQYLALSVNEFNGSIPRDIGNLTMLKELNLGVNKLTGVIPFEIGNLAHLEILIKGNATLTGTIPSTIFNMSSLKIIDFGYNSLSGSLPMDIYNLPVLEGIFLPYNHLTGQIPSGLWECRRLQKLTLTNNRFTGALPDEIGNLNLEVLKVGENNLTGLIPFKIFNISTMKILSLCFNQFSGHLPSSMGLRLPNVEEIYLNYNELSGPIPRSVTNASNLIILALTNNSFTGAIPNTFGDLRLLRQLFLGQNYLTREPSTPELRFFSSLANCRQLELFSISKNLLNGILPTSFGNLSNSLQRFDAGDCKIKGEIPIGIGNLSNLEALLLDRNELTGSIPTTLGKLTRLRGLNLGQNKLQGSIPNDLCLLKNLGDFYLSDNKINGSIPACFGEVKSLRWLHLDSNKLTSTVPLTLWSHEDLLGLNLSSNSLSGNLPSDIGSLRVITQIDLSWNQLSGDIPTTIGGAQMLSHLFLDHNLLQGYIPQSMGNLINLEFLDLSNNNFSGVIPMSLEALRYLQHFNVSFNRLQGQIPTGGHFANFTDQSFMENDALCGAPQLQVQPCPSNTFRRSRSKILPSLKYILPPTTVATIVLALIYVLSARQRSKINLAHVDSLPLSWRRISYHELFQATDAFCGSNLIGMGSVGSVYKGTLSDGMDMAVKVFNLEVDGAIKSFKVECEVMRNIRHRNLIKIISICTNLDFKALVLEYMPNRSLEKGLYSHNYCLNILQRLNIMIDVASALKYLHHGHTTPIVHCDVKPSNILLDEHMIAHVCDFGISKLLAEAKYIAQTKTLATIGYIAPEYGIDGIVSTKVDVYSYGILLMETFTRKKPTDEMFSVGLSLRSWVNAALLGSIIQVVDTNLMGREDEHFLAKTQCVSSILGLAIDCSTTSPKERISMEEVVIRLNKIKSTFLANTESLSRHSSFLLPLTDQFTAPSRRPYRVDSGQMEAEAEMEA